MKHIAEEKKKKYNNKIKLGIFLIIVSFVGGFGYSFNPTYPAGLLNLLLLIGGCALWWCGWKDLKKEGHESQKDSSRYSLCAITSLFFAFCGGFLGIILGIIAIILGIIALLKIKKDPNLKGKAMAITAIIIAIPISLMWLNFVYISPEEYLPEQTKDEMVKDYCQKICLAELSTDNIYTEINQENTEQYICSCLDENYTILEQYDITLEQNSSE